MDISQNDEKILNHSIISGDDDEDQRPGDSQEKQDDKGDLEDQLLLRLHFVTSLALFRVSRNDGISFGVLVVLLVFLEIDFYFWHGLMIIHAQKKSHGITRGHSLILISECGSRWSDRRCGPFRS